MKVCQFNFNNEVDSFEIHVEDDGRAIVPGEDGPLAEYASVQQLAEIYAQSRDVKPENLKNWVLLENGSVYSFVLRAGTAGVNVSDVEEQLEQVFQNLAGEHHALSIARAKEQIMADGAADLVEVLVHCTETDVARDVYDAMQEHMENQETAIAKVSDEPEDTRSDLEKYLEDMEEIPGALSLLSYVVGLPVETEKQALLETLQNNYAFSNVSTLQTIFNNAISDVRNGGIGINTTADAITLILQRAVGTKDDEMKHRLAYTAQMAKRNKVNLSVDIVGTTHIRHTAELVSVEELEGLDLFVRDNVPYIVRFSDTIDAEIEAERDAAAAEEPYEEETYEEDDYEEEEDY